MLLSARMSIPQDSIMHHRHLLPSADQCCTQTAQSWLVMGHV